MHNILAATSGVVSTRALGAGRQNDNSVGRAAARAVGFLLHAIAAFVRQPRFVMSFGMIFFSFSLALNAAGVKPADVAKVSLRPSALRHAYNDAQIKVVKYYDNIRFVYEIESKVRELKRANTPAEPAPEYQKEEQKQNRKNNTSGQPDQRQDRNYSQEYDQPMLAALQGCHTPWVRGGGAACRDGDHKSEVCMNCANHADASAVAYCRTCGKALCANCTRPVRGVIYCEDCLGAKMEGVPAGAAGFVSGTVPQTAAQGRVPPPPPSGWQQRSEPDGGWNSGRIFPFGVGAVYTGQYAKGLAHLGIFALLVAGCNAAGDVKPDDYRGFGIAFFWFLPDYRRRALGARHPVWPARTRSLRPGVNFWRRSKDRGQQSSDGRHRAHSARRDLSAAHGGSAGAELPPFLAGDSHPARRLDVREPLGMVRWTDRLPLPALPGAMPDGTRHSGDGRCDRADRQFRTMLAFSATWPVILLVVGGVKLLQGTASMEGHISAPWPHVRSLLEGPFLRSHRYRPFRLFRQLVR